LDNLYPTSSETITAWRLLAGVPADEARKRFVQYVILESIAAAPSLAGSIAFKGGNALRFAYGSRRSTTDLDFTAEASFPDDEGPIRARLDEALRSALSRHRVKARCQRVRRNPASREKTRPTYDISVGFLLPGDRLYNNFESSKNLPSTVDVEISINELVCEVVSFSLNPGGKSLRVCSLEDITAEKLRALLQQPIRKRSRPQDVYDIANIARLGLIMDDAKVSTYLTLKSEARDIHPRKGSFDDTVRDLAVIGYEDLMAPDDPDFIPFDEAWARVLELVAKLSIPA
jgi:predicted nucleotidyltransferase component of viral defense system